MHILSTTKTSFSSTSIPNFIWILTGSRIFASVWQIERDIDEAVDGKPMWSPLSRWWAANCWRR